MGNHRLGKMQMKLNSMGKRGKPGAHFNGKSQVYNTWLISVEKNQKRLNSMGKRGQPGAHFNRKFQV